MSCCFVMAKQSVRPQFQQDSEIFRQYAELIALDFELPLRSDDDFQHLFEALASRLDSYRIKKSAVKKGRWFSWHNGCQDHHAEYFATRMLLSWGYPNEPNPDDSSKSLNELRAAGDSLGGLKLGLQCMSFKNRYGRARGPPCKSWLCHHSAGQSCSAGAQAAERSGVSGLHQ